MEELASNGESVRGKVFHIACALCVQGPMDGPGQEVFKSWCEMVSRLVPLSIVLSCDNHPLIVSGVSNAAPANAQFSAITFVQMPVPPPGEGVDSSANTPLPS
jgi:hypothetical protein